MNNIIHFQTGNAADAVGDSERASTMRPLSLGRETLEWTVLPAVLAVIVSMALAYSIKCCFASNGQLSSPLQTIWYMAPLSLGSLLVSSKTSGWIRAIVLFQIATTSLLVVNGLSGAHAALFADIFSAVVCGGTSGALNASFRMQQRRLQSQTSEIELRRRQLKDAKLALVKHDEVERRLLAADLHDQVLHDLKMIKQTLSSCRFELDERSAESLQSDVGHCVNAVREVMEQLFPSSLEHLGLVGAIEECLDNAGRRSDFESFVRAKADVNGFEALSRVETLLLFRLIQEAVNNISKHARAKSVACHLTREKDQLVVRVIDDGVGLKEGGSDGRGLKYMKQRAELIGAQIAWLPNRDGSGTVVEIRITRQDQDAQRAKVVS